MQIKEIKANNKTCVVVNSDQVEITDTQSALDFVMSIKYNTDCDRIAINKEAIDDKFFILSSGLGGDILQKFVTYQIKLAIIGDFSVYTSKPLRDFIYESNHGNDAFFVSTEQEASDKLTQN